MAVWVLHTRMSTLPQKAPGSLSYVALGYPSESRNIGEVYKLLVLNAEKELDNRFSMLPASHPARAPYALFSQSSDTVRSGVIIGLGSRL